MSPVVRAIVSVRHFSNFCDGWYHVDDIVTILVNIFTFPDNQSLKDNHRMLNKTKRQRFSDVIGERTINECDNVFIEVSFNKWSKALCLPLFQQF